MGRGSEILKIAAAVSFAIGSLEVGGAVLHGVNYWQDIFRSGGNTPGEKAAYQTELGKVQQQGEDDLGIGAVGLAGGTIFLAAHEIARRRRPPTISALNP